MADELVMNKKDNSKTIVVNRLTLKYIIEFIAVYQSMREVDVSENMEISARTLSNIKKPTESVYMSMHMSKIDNVVEYVYNLAETIEQKVEM